MNLNYGEISAQAQDWLDAGNQATIETICEERGEVSGLNSSGSESFSFENLREAREKLAEMEGPFYSLDGDWGTIDIDGEIEAMPGFSELDGASRKMILSSAQAYAVMCAKATQIEWDIKEVKDWIDEAEEKINTLYREINDRKAELNRLFGRVVEA